MLPAKGKSSRLARFYASHVMGILIWLLSGCGAPPTSQPPPTATRQAYQPLETSECRTLARTLSNYLSVSIEITHTTFEDQVHELSGTGCQLTFTSYTPQFVTLAGIVKALRSGLAAEGWIEDARFASSGGAMIGSAFRKNDKLCLYLAREDVIGENQTRFSVSLNCAQAINRPDSTGP